jgi:SSS family solute:Na+ symporter
MVLNGRSEVRVVQGWKGYLGLAVLPAYLLATILIGWLSRRTAPSTANEFLNASRSLPLWVAASSFFSINCGALEIVGLSAVAAQYGVQAFHFYWIGAIPGMVFLGGLMIPLYMRSGVRSLPEYLERRFDARVRLINAWLLLITGTALSGIGLYGVGQVLNAVFGWPFSRSAAVAAAVVLIYVVLGGLRATIYNEVFRIVIIVLGLIPLLWLPTTVIHPAHSLPGPRTHLWLGLPGISPAATLDQFGVIAGLGFVLSFSYWCTDFVLVQRALTAKTVEAGRMVPLLAGFGKLGFSLLLIGPALGAQAFMGTRAPASFDQTLPALMAASYAPIMLGTGLTVLLASLMSALASNVSAFSALWTEEIYRRSIRCNAGERHYIRVGRASIVGATLLSVATSYVAFRFRDLMEYVQLIFSLFSAPFFAIFLIGLFTRRATARGAMVGLVSGVAVGFAHLGLVLSGRVVYGSMMNANFYAAMLAFLTALVVGVVFSRTAERRCDAQLEKLVSRLGTKSEITAPSKLWWMLATALLLTCAWLNYVWR